MQRGLGILVLLDPYFESIASIEGSRSVAGPTVHIRFGVDLAPWSAAAHDANEIVGGRPVGPLSWRWVRSFAPKLSAQELSDVGEYADTVRLVHAERTRATVASGSTDPEADGAYEDELNEALDRQGLCASGRNRLVRNLDDILWSVLRA